MPDDQDQIDWLGPAEFIFQTPVRGRKRTKGLQAKPKRHRAGLAGTVLRVIRRQPEVMVKVTGSARGFKSIKEHLAYITRNGKLMAERENGELIQGSRNVQSLAKDWWSDDHKGRGGRRRDTVNLILSMPVGTDRGAVAAAARDFARSEFAGRVDYLMAVHEDTDHPHVHLTVKTHGLQGQYLDPHKGELQAWREVFAAALRKRGVKAEATPRRARGAKVNGRRFATWMPGAHRASRAGSLSRQSRLHSPAPPSMKASPGFRLGGSASARRNVPGRRWRQRSRGQANSPPPSKSDDSSQTCRPRIPSAKL